MVGCAGANRTAAGLNADQLARTVSGTVLAGEISLIAALASGDLLRSHMALNRKKDGASSARHYSTSAYRPQPNYGEMFEEYFPIP